MSVLLQISDTHFGTERLPVMEALLELAGALRPDVLVLSGDITQRARRKEFDGARRLVERIAAPALLAIPGNHDIPLFNLAARLADPYGGYAKVFGRDLEPSYESHDLLVLSVNTTRAYRHKHGEVSATQIARVARRLEACAKEKLRIVVTHHPMHVPPGPEEANLLRGHAEATHAWARAGVDIVMGGHIHLPFARQIDAGRPLWVVQAGTAVSHRVRPGGERNSVNVVRCDRSLTAIERWDHDAARDRFELVDRTPIVLNR